MLENLHANNESFGTLTFIYFIFNIKRLFSIYSLKKHSMSYNHYSGYKKVNLSILNVYKIRSIKILKGTFNYE